MSEGKSSAWGYTLALAAVGLITGTLGVGGRSSAHELSPVASESSKDGAAPAATAASLDGMGRQLLALSMGDTLQLRARAPFPLDTPLVWKPLPDTTLGVTIATIPDPVDSHQDWAYDAFLESFRRAHERAGYAVDRMWLPWLRPDSVLDAPTLRVREVYPGVILFRSPSPKPATRATPRYRLLYLAGEVPTAGVQPRALYHAIAERDFLLGRDSAALARTPLPAGRLDTLRVVGPTFSGSSRGLASILGRWQRQAPSVRHVSVVTGSATSPSNQTALRPDSTFSFGATIHSDDAVLRVLNGTVLPRLHLHQRNLAVLSEGSTAYGRGFENNKSVGTQESPPSAKPAGRAPGATDAASEPGEDAAEVKSHERAEGTPLRLSFPLNIGTLRSEYARRPAEGKAEEGAAEPGVPVSLQDAARPMESPLTASGLTPAAVDLSLNRIARTLRDHDIRVVAIAASDVRDRLFLATELRHRLRDVHFVVLESNALYLSPEYNGDLRGMLVLSTYPLALETQVWSPLRQLVPFSAEYAQGVYNATLLQLGERGSLLEYGIPGRGGVQAPPVWVSVLGASSLTPMLAVDEPDGYVTPDSAAAAQPAPEPRLDFVTGTIVAGTLLLALWLLLSAWRAAGRAPSPTPPFAPIPQPLATELGVVPASEADLERIDLFRRAEQGSLRYQEALYRWILAVAAVGVLLPALVTNAGAAFRAPWNDGLAGTILFFMAMGSLVAAGCLLAALGVSTRALYRSWTDHRPDFELRMAGSRLDDPWRVNAYARRFVALLASGYLLATLAYAGEVGLAAGRNVLAFTLLVGRAWDLEGGLSPTLPLVVAGTAFAAWAWWHLRRLKALGCTTPFEVACMAADPAAELRDVERDEHLDRHDDNGQWVRMLTPRIIRGVRQGRARLFRMVPRGALPVVAVLAIVCGCVAMARDHAPESLAGVRTFEWVYRLGLVGMVATTGWGVFRLLMAWNALSRVLRGVAATPLVTAFERLPRRVSRLTRLSFFGVPRSAVIAPVAATQWRHLSLLAQGLVPRAPAGKVPVVGAIVTAPGEAVTARTNVFMPAPHAAPVATAEREAADAPSPDEAALRQKAARYAAPDRQPSPGLARWCYADAAGANFLELSHLLEELWRREPEQHLVAGLSAELAKEKVGLEHEGPSTSGRLRRTFSRDLGLWHRAAEEYAAVQVVDYIEWAIGQIRVLALFLFASLLLLVLHEAAYPYQPQSLVKLILFTLLLVTVGAVLKVMLEMNRDDVLSRIAGTEPGKVTLDRHFIVNALIFGLVPLCTLISSEFPVVRSILFAWIYPITRMLGGGG